MKARLTLAALAAAGLTAVAPTAQATTQAVTVADVPNNRPTPERILRAESWRTYLDAFNENGGCREDFDQSYRGTAKITSATDPDLVAMLRLPGTNRYVVLAPYEGACDA
jgi:ABC-type glycerol-3-phosphate transport system substrate-binding protein